MKATDELMIEHRVIERVLRVLETVSDGAEPEVKVKVVRHALDFIRNFADACHHGKEEGALFPAMERNGVPQSDGPIHVMLVEHQLGRNYVKKLGEVVERLAKGDRKAGADVDRFARAYAALLSEHIPKEENILYPMACNILSDADDRKLMKQYEEIEAKMGKGTHEKFHALVEEMEAEAGLGGEMCGCSHHGH